ncbi:MAG: hypothetical protein WBX25_26845 [Rhodomicrobium sp.]
MSTRQYVSPAKLPAALRALDATPIIYKDGEDLLEDKISKSSHGLRYIVAADVPIGAPPLAPNRTLAQSLEMLSDPNLDEWWRSRVRSRDLAYGFWPTESGALVIFNRGYSPIWCKPKDGSWRPANRDWWVPNIARKRSGEEAGDTFYYDFDSERTKVRKALKAMVKLGILAEADAAKVLSVKQRGNKS